MVPGMSRAHRSQPVIEAPAEAPTASESWDLEEGDEIAPGRFALERLGGG
jgi:hypothetical protein